MLGGCATLEDFFGTAPGKLEAPAVPLEQRPVEEPIAANHFVLESPGQSVIGVPQVVFTHSTDTLSDLARAYGLGFLDGSGRQDCSTRPSLCMCN